MLTKLWNKTEFYVVAYPHQGSPCMSTLWIVMNRLCQLMHANGLHGQHSCQSYGYGAVPCC